MEPELTLELDGRAYAWTGEGWCAAADHIQPPAAIAQRLNALVRELNLERQQRLVSHVRYLQEIGVPYRGVQARRGCVRVTYCWRCKHDLDNRFDDECISCGWILCGCGACGCRH